jgi:uncharacterized FlaG/YvyC family protein
MVYEHPSMGETEMSIPPISPYGRAGYNTERPESAAVTRKQVDRTVAGLRQSGIIRDEQEISFTPDAQTKKMIIRVIDKNSGAVHLQIPAEYLIQFGHQLDKLLKSDEPPR